MRRPRDANLAPINAASNASRTVSEHRSVVENTAAGTAIGKPVTTEDPEGDTLTYSLIGADAGHFAIDAASGQLRTKGALDYESKRTYRVVVMASDGRLFGSIPVDINVRDVNEAPAYAGSAATVSVAENTAANTNIGSPLTAADPDAGDTLTYTLGTTTDDGHFAIDANSGQLQTKGALDYEGQSSYAVTVTATDDGGLTASIAVTITVTDVADTPPDQPAALEIINVQQTSFRVTWTAPAAGSSPITGYGIQYKLDGAADSAYADVQPTPTGTVTGYNVVNRSGQSVAEGTSYAVRVRASNAEGWGPWSAPAVATTAGVSNQAPSYAAATATVSVAENTAANTNIGSPLTATDPDAGDTLTYTLGTTADDGHFAIDASSGQLQTKGALDYEGQSSYAVTVTATDGDGLSDSIPVTINVTNVNEAPAYAGSAATVSVAENTAANTNIGNPVAAADPDAGDTLAYTLGTTADDGHFAIDASSGQLQTKGALDYEGQSSYAVTVTATDGDGLTASISVTIEVTDVNEAPAYPAASAWVIVSENTAAGANIISPAEATDPDAGDTVTYSLGGTDQAHFTIDSATSELQTKEALDYEGKSSYSLSVTATDGGGLTASIAVTINVNDVNEAPAYVDAAITVNVAENTAVGTDIGDPVVAADPDAGDTLTYALGGDDKEHFSIDSASGQLKTKGALDYEGQSSYAVTVTATDGDGLAASIGVTVNVTDISEGQPGNVRLNLRSNGRGVRAIWDAPQEAGAETYYQVRRWPDLADSDYAVIASRVVDANGDGEVRYRTESSELEAGQTYWYSVRAFAGSGEALGEWTEGVSITLPAAADPVAAKEERQGPVNQAPAYADAAITVSVAENTVAGTDIGSPLAAADPDAGDTLTYTLGGDDKDHFSIDSASGQLQTQGALDYEGKGSYAVTVTASDGDGLTASIAVTVTVTDVNEAPAYANASASLSVAENTATGADIGSPVVAADPDDGDTLTYTMGTTADDGHFAIDSASGQLQTQGTLDYEGKSSYSVTVTATDGGGRSASIAVNVGVTDVADTPPGQPATPQIINVEETRFRITWTAPAAGSSAITGYGIQYKLAGAEDSAYADVKPTPTGTATGYNLVNRSGQTVTKGTSYAVRVRASNAEGWGPWSASAVATTTGATPAPANEAPAYANAIATLSVAENTAAGTDIGAPVTATDPDGDSLTYTLGTTADDDHFAIDSATGQLQSQGALDYEGKASYSVTVTATDGGGLSASIAVAVSVTNINEAPAYADDSATLSVAENTATGADIANPLTAADPDAGDTLTYALGGTDQDHFAIDSATGQLQTQGALDYEGRSSYSVTVTATDGGGRSASIAVAVGVTDVAEQAAGQRAAQSARQWRHGTRRLGRSRNGGRRHLLPGALPAGPGGQRVHSHRQPRCRRQRRRRNQVSRRKPCADGRADLLVLGADLRRKRPGAGGMDGRGQHNAAGRRRP